jgi:hypothetical protein
MQFEYPFSETLGTKSISDFRIVQILEYLHVHNKTSGHGIKINTKLIYVSSTLFNHRLKVILYNIFSSPVSSP